jgi:hypothetical protein
MRIRLASIAILQCGCRAEQHGITVASVIDMATKRRTSSSRRRSSSKRGSHKRAVLKASARTPAEGGSKDRAEKIRQRGPSPAADRRQRRAKGAEGGGEARRSETRPASEHADANLTRAFVASGAQALRMAAAVAQNMAKGVRGKVEERDRAKDASANATTDPARGTGEAARRGRELRTARPGLSADRP